MRFRTRMRVGYALKRLHDLRDKFELLSSPFDHQFSPLTRFHNRKESSQLSDIKESEHTTRFTRNARVRISGFPKFQALFPIRHPCFSE